MGSGCCRVYPGPPPHAHCIVEVAGLGDTTMGRVKGQMEVLLEEGTKKNKKTAKVGGPWCLTEQAASMAETWEDIRGGGVFT